MMRMNNAFVIPCTCNCKNFHVKRNFGSYGGIMQNVPSSYLNPLNRERVNRAGNFFFPAGMVNINTSIYLMSF